MADKMEDKSSASHKIMTVVGVVICIILIPILIINVTLIIKSYKNNDEVPKIGGYCPLIVLTGSMEPKISSGDLIICKQIDADQVKIGDIIAFFDPDSTGQAVLTHRVTEIVNENGSLMFRTKGDANNSEDRSLVPADDLVGIYKSKISGAGNVAMFMQTTAGLVVCVIVPLILLIAYDVIRRRRFEAQNQQDTAALLAELQELKAQKAAEESKKPEESVNSETKAEDHEDPQ